MNDHPPTFLLLQAARGTDPSTIHSPLLVQATLIVSVRPDDHGAAVRMANGDTHYAGADANGYPNGFVLAQRIAACTLGITRVSEGSDPIDLRSTPEPAAVGSGS